MLFGIEKAYCDAMISALIEANRTMLDTLVEEAVSKSHVPFKGDTLGLDQRPENTITAELLAFDQHAILITEERGEDANPLTTISPATVHGARTFYGCDPCDRSSELRQFLQDNSHDGDRVADIIRRPEVVRRWEARYSKPAIITGANAAITCIRRGIPFCSVVLNYITQCLTIASAAGIYHLKLPRKSRSTFNFDYARERGTLLHFTQPGSNNGKRVVAFVGKPERGYPQNFNQSKMVIEHELSKCLHYTKPGGPTRILYLSTMQPQTKPVGFIMANGEKFGEWIHWLPFILSARQQADMSAHAMRLFEVTQEKSLMRDGYLMMPSIAYSIFKDVGDGRVIINVDFLRSLDNPSKYRATLIVTPATNRWAMSRVEQYGYREIKF